jgi:transposase
MVGKDIIAMTQEELKRLHVIHKSLDRSITQVEAAGIIGVCLRQVQRIVRIVRAEGDKGIIHKSRGKVSNRALPDKIKDKVLKLYKEKYPDFGPTLATEKLFEIDKIKINNETLRLWLLGAGISYKKRKLRPHRQWRQRKQCFGQMIQLDGSHHDWFEGRGEKCVLMGYIDDATGNPFGRFYAYEGTLPAMDSFKSYIKKYGIPVSIYLDKHTTYKSNKKQTIEDELNDIEPLSQFARAAKELSVNLIYANSPQAKGRIERLFHTFQDRLIKEMRLENIKTIEEANKFLIRYLPAYGKRFSVSPANNTNLHRAIPEDVNLDKILCIRTTRTLRNDFTIAHNGKLYQVEDNLNAKEVTVEERINGSMLIVYKDKVLRYREITKRPQKVIEAPKSHLSARAHTPPKDHSWRNFRFGSTEKEEVLVGAL